MIGLALGGGAGLGWAHIGVLRAFEARGVEIGAVAGTSIGALAAVCMAADRLDVLETMARSTNIRTVLRYLDVHLRRGAWIGGRRIAHQLHQHLGHARFENLRIPCAVVASDLITGFAEILREGEVVPAVQASMALPGIFQPVQIGGRFLVDGGLVDPVPVGAVRLLAPHLPVVAVNLQNDYVRRARAVGLRPEHRLHPSVLNIARASMGLMLSHLARQSLQITPPDLELALPVGHIDVRDFTKAQELIDIGGAAVTEKWPEIEQLILRSA